MIIFKEDNTVLLWISRLIREFELILNFQEHFQGWIVKDNVACKSRWIILYKQDDTVVCGTGVWLPRLSFS